MVSQTDNVNNICRSQCFQQPIQLQLLNAGDSWISTPFKHKFLDQNTHNETEQRCFLQIKSAVEVTNNQTRKQKISKHLLKQNGRYVCSLQQKMMLEMQNGWTRFDGRFSTVLQLTRWRVYSIANPYNIRLYLYILYIYSIPTNTCYLLSLCEAIDVLCFVYSSSENPYNPLVTRHDDCVKCKW